jgi:exosortase
MTGGPRYESTTPQLAPVFSWPIVLGFCFLMALAVQTLAKETWSHEEGAHGPLVLCIVVWLLWRNLPSIRKVESTGSPTIVAVSLLLSLAAFILGEAFDFITLGTAGTFGVAATIFYSRFGIQAVVHNRFAFLYLLFALPPPSSWIDRLTFPLKQLVSTAATAILQVFGLPVVHEGVVIYVAQYQLLVEDACSGLNSIIGLLVITFIYIYLARGNSWRQSVFLACLTIPIAITANAIRIIVLILLTYYDGDDVAQGFLHQVAGIFVFLLSLLLIVAIDAAIFGPSSKKFAT